MRLRKKSMSLSVKKVRGIEEEMATLQCFYNKMEALNHQQHLFWWNKAKTFATRMDVDWSQYPMPNILLWLKT